MAEPVVIVGMGMSPADLTAAHLAAIAAAEVLIGGERHLSAFADFPGERIAITGDLKALVTAIEQRREKRIVVLASGDPLYYGIGGYLAAALGSQRVSILPNVNAVAAAFSRMKRPWQDAAVISLHGRNRKADLIGAVRARPAVAVFTDPVHHPAAVAGMLREAGLDGVRMWVMSRLGTAEESVGCYELETVTGMTVAEPNMVVLERESGTRSDTDPCFGISDDAFAHEKGLITKSEVRAVSLAKLQLHPGVCLWDLGAGSGAVSIEAAGLIRPGRVVAVERHPDRIRLIEDNRDRFHAGNLEVVQADLPTGMDALPTPDRVFIGGGGRVLGELVSRSIDRMPGTGPIVVNCVMLSSLNAAIDAFTVAGWASEVVQLQVGKGVPIGDGQRIAAQNPVWIVTAWNREEKH